MNRREIAHAWAHGQKPNARAGNVRFDGPDLYSYSTIIGRVYVRPSDPNAPGLVAVNVRRYSSSTSGHQAAMRGAIPRHWVTLSYQGGGGSFYGYGSGDPGGAVALIRGQWKEALGRLRTLRHATRGEALRDVAELRNLQAAARVLGGRELQSVRSYDVDAIPNGAKWAAQAARWERADELSRIRSEAASKAAETRRAESRRRWGMTWEERQAEDERKAAERVEKWRKGHGAPPPSRYGAPHLLRVKGEAVEVSNGAKIPADAARLVWQAWNAGRLAPGMHAGPFTVREVAADHFVAGCTRIDRPEAERIAAAMGW